MVAKTLLAILLTLFSTIVVAGKYVKPDLVEEYRDRLNYVFVEVNGTRVTVRANQTLNVIQGSTVRILEAVDNSGDKQSIVNFIGYPGLTTDDRGLVVDTARDLLPEWSLPPDTYAARATSVRGDIGEIFIRLIPIFLEYAEVEIGGETHIVRDKQELRISRDSRVRIKKLRTNRPTVKGIKVDMVRIETPENILGRVYKLRFKFANHEFASILARTSD